VSTSAVVFLGFRLSRRPATERYPYGMERAEDLAGIGIATVIWASAAFAGYQSIHKLLAHGHTTHQVTADVVRRLADGIDPSIITTAESAAGSVPGVLHAHARARWTGRTLRVEIEGWVDPDLPTRDADAIGRQVATAVAQQLPQVGSLTWASRAGPS
jgi:divalent metal cation (Fe/Co/Zn/Cd) transporter